MLGKNNEPEIGCRIFSLQFSGLLDASKHLYERVDLSGLLICPVCNALDLTPYIISRNGQNNQFTNHESERTG